MDASDFLAGLPLWFLLGALGVLGAIWGSFVAALCSRWPNGETVATGRSRCDQCGVNIAAYDLVPILSFVLLRGKCRSCGQKIGAMPLLVEVAAIVIGAIPALSLPPIHAVALSAFGWLLLPLIILDYRHFWLPDRLIILLGIVGLVAGPLLTPSVAWADRAAGLLAGFGVLEAIRLGYKRWRGHDGMGAGDPKLFGVLGIWLGWQALPMTLLGASVIGLALVLAARLVASESQRAFPLGTYLGSAAFMVAVLV